MLSPSIGRQRLTRFPAPLCLTTRLCAFFRESALLNDSKTYVGRLTAMSLFLRVRT
jgi:hypothetical protein